MPEKMPPHSSSSSINRRQFLRSVLGLTGGLLLANSGLLKTASAETSAALPQAAIWWQSLTDDKLHQQNGFPVPVGMPGSIMKLVAATALLEENLLSPNQTFECRGSLELGGTMYHCQHAHGSLALREALGVSCNLFFAQASEPLSVKRFLQYAERFGLNQHASKSDPFVFPQARPAFSFVQPYVLGLAPDFKPNALQLIRMTRQIALKNIPDIHSNTWQLLHQGMQLCITQGTASQLDIENKLHIAAKTGTTPYGQNYQSWLVGFFPLENPHTIFCVRSPVGTAKDVAVPLARKFFMAQKWL